MGLGLHGGGAAAARFFSGRGCDVTVTDLRTEEVLEPSIRALNGLTIKYVLGTHDEADFRRADFVIKNPAVPPDSPFLAKAKRIETDITVFLHYSDARFIAVTGTKGKSTTASAVHHCLTHDGACAFLGGNITTSPLDFLEEITKMPRPVVLELSSWQLADAAHRGLLTPEISVVTNVLRDHQNRYSEMSEYVKDKQMVCAEQQAGSTAVLNYDDPVVRRFDSVTKADVAFISARPLPVELRGAWFTDEGAVDNLAGKPDHIMPRELRVPGEHSRLNMLAAATASVCFGLDRRAVRDQLSTFGGIPHRLEHVASVNGVAFINDSAATIPDATVAATASYDRPIHLVMGGTDKKLDFGVLKRLRARSIHLLEGSASTGIRESLSQSPVSGPFTSLDDAFSSAVAAASKGDIVLFSPGCASFEMFLNEFDRGNSFKRLVKKLADEDTESVYT